LVTLRKHATTGAHTQQASTHTQTETGIGKKEMEKETSQRIAAYKKGAVTGQSLSFGVSFCVTHSYRYNRGVKL